MQADYPYQSPLDCLQIEVTTHCNLRCPECSRTLHSANGTWENLHMPVALFESIVRKCPPASTLIVQGVGEPTLHPEFLELLACAKGLGKFGAITFYTNGLARPVQYYLDLLESGLSGFVISVDSFDPDIAKSCRAGTDVARLRTLLAAVSRRTRPNVSIVLSMKNLADLPATLLELNALGPVTVSIQPLANYRPEVDDNTPNQYALNEEAMQVYEAMKSGFKELYPNLDVCDAGLAYARKNGEASRFGAGKVYCRRPFTYPFITSAGYLSPCCLVHEPDVLGRASLAGRSFDEVWASRSVQDWLHELVTATPAVCADCILNPNPTGR
ncbi:radical SAM protein [Fundidesulfovibrio terrae]|uniref:radical SAM protein n=1 Tax=Fundidesulfovibrio terrae TaxID=2922866 RepID=UPI001FB01B8B|nr:radical SAM protein [Fundidesulfovibrio terrae]